MKYEKAFAMAVLTMAILLFGSLPATAQQSDPNFTRLRTSLKVTDKLTVTRSDGSKAEGRLLEISADRIVLQEKGGPQNIAATEITTVQRRHNGVLLGFIVGAGAGAALAFWVRAVYSEDRGGHNKSTDFVLVPVGAGIGTAIDFMISSNRTVYDRNSKKGITASPILDRERKGVKLALNF